MPGINQEHRSPRRRYRRLAQLFAGRNERRALGARAQTCFPGITVGEPGHTGQEFPHRCQGVKSPRATKGQRIPPPCRALSLCLTQWKPGNLYPRDHSLGGAVSSHDRPRFFKAYSFGLITGLFFLISWVGQFFAQMVVERNEAEQHGQAFSWSEFWPQFLQSTLENWQSEFLQLVWQAAGLALFYFWGSSQSKESDDRIEAKIDRLLTEHNIDPADYDRQVLKEAASG